MGFFGTFVYADGLWNEIEDMSDDLPEGSSLRVHVHDSDLAQVDYRPCGPGRGRFYVGWEPAAYFGDPTLNEPVDTRTEAEGFSTWAALVAGRPVRPDSVRPLLADGEGRKDLFVEDTVVRLLSIAGVPLPDTLPHGP